MRTVRWEPSHRHETVDTIEPGLVIRHNVRGTDENNLNFSTRRGDYSITTDPGRFDLVAIHAYLTPSYWSPGISFMLATRDAHDLYRALGFREQANPSRLMEVLNPDAYNAP